ncbi:16S rRNA (uracil(1498)-N(3))-methyltransferase [Liquorilactobacillus capillatus]|uniref:Ribosomal RNA small subunit methyltransferase E n=1 Tax=Liquorilactobacillus capillatus DSM 19910 TaxID=1423731 RepID=A0A0R1M921_9LACO|nr:16S rRNA (uracil(1498)-N(3))-methyltransferase [Liquorilactobacillus capillatus]KRL01274.1 hypothetical protein FC81_GL001415 [Liquorilactobacillus capillatus DSM 19910]
MQRYFIEIPQINERLVLPTNVYHHAITVMRLKPGARFEAVAADQKVTVMQLVEVTDETAVAKVCHKFTQTVELPLEVTIVCGLSKKDKADWIVQKGTELGAQHFIFFAGDYSVARWDQKKRTKKLARLRKIITGASEQAHRLSIPTVEYIEDLHSLTLEHYSERVVAYEEAAKQGEKSILAQLISRLKTVDKLSQTHLVAVFGPEGGISPAEIQYLQQNNFLLAGLGPRIMRAETAPLYMLVALSYAFELA